MGGTRIPPETGLNSFNIFFSLFLFFTSLSYVTQVHQTVSEECKKLEKEIDYGVQCPVCEQYYKVRRGKKEEFI